jgi:ABC-type transport system involved in Fe-S cluster assembly fused permease/ATPase subunit
VADNIRFGRPDATRAEVEAAARAIGADPVILALPQCYDTEVGERGALLSAGERQLVAFARAWLADPALLILDEATSNLDVATETRVTEAMRQLRQGRTTIVIAHRLSTVIEADQIAVIQDGQVAEVGPPEELLARGGLPGGRHLWVQRQSSAASPPLSGPISHNPNRHQSSSGPGCVACAWSRCCRGRRSCRRTATGSRPPRPRRSTR